MFNDDPIDLGIICLDDEPRILELYRAILYGSLVPKDGFLGNYGFNKKIHPKLYIVETGDEAIEVFEERGPDEEIVAGFFDMRLQGSKTGLDVIRKLREYHPHLNCTIVTGYYDKALEETAKVFGEECQDEWAIMRKPFTPWALRHRASQMVLNWHRKRVLQRLMAENDRLYREMQRLSSSLLLRVVDEEQEKPGLASESLPEVSTRPEEEEESRSEEGKAPGAPIERRAPACSL